MYAYVKYDDGKTDIVPVKKIKKFDPEHYVKNKKYKIRQSDGQKYEGLVLMLDGKKIHCILYNPRSIIYNM